MDKTISLNVLIFFLSLNSITSSSSAADSKSKAAPISKSDNLLASKAVEIINRSCVTCHNAEKSKGGLNLSNREDLLKGGSSGSVVDSKHISESMLLRLLKPGSDPHMPPKGQLNPSDQKALRNWVARGLPWPEPGLHPLALTPGPVKLKSLPTSYQPILGIAIATNGSALVAGRGHRVLYYGLTESNAFLRGEYAFHDDPVQSIAMSNDSKHVAVGAFRKLSLFEAGDRLSPQWQITNSISDRVSAMIFSSDGSRLFVSDGVLGIRGRILEVDAKAGRIRRFWDAHADVILDLSVSSNDLFLASGSADKLIKIWDLSVGRESYRLEGHSAPVYGVSLRGDGIQLASAGADKQLRIWDVKTREKLIDLGNASQPVVGIRWAIATNLVVSLNERGEIQSYTDFKQHTGEQSSSSGTERRVGSAGEGATCIAISTDAHLIAVGNSEGVVSIWNRAGKKMVELLP